MIATAFSWFLLGLLVGCGIGGVVVGIYGDSELNETVRNLRKVRLELQKAKTELTIRKLFNKHPDLTLKITPKAQKDD